MTPETQGRLLNAMFEIARVCELEGSARAVVTLDHWMFLNFAAALHMGGGIAPSEDSTTPPNGVVLSVGGCCLMVQGAQGQGMITPCNPPPCPPTNPRH